MKRNAILESEASYKVCGSCWSLFVIGTPTLECYMGGLVIFIGYQRDMWCDKIGLCAQTIDGMLFYVQ